MQFDSHVHTLLTAAVGLVNALTPGHDGTAPVAVPEGAERRRAVIAVLVSRGSHGRVDDAEAAAFVPYADAARAIVVAAERDDVDTAAALVNELLERTSARPRLDRSEEGWGLHFHGPDDGVVLGWAAGFASALALCVGSEWAGRLGICAAAPCDRAFLDESRNRSRRFCSTRCQNRVKAAAHRGRRPPVSSP